MRTVRVVFILLLSQACFGQGFLFDSFDARSLGMASAPFASPSDASTLFLNPASCAYLHGLHVDAGAMLNIRTEQFQLLPSKTAANPAFSGQTANGTEGFPLGNFVYSPQQIPLGVGVAVTEPFQFHTDWQSQWAGSTISHQADAHTLFTTLALGYKLSRMIYIGAGLHIATGGIDMLRYQNDTLLAGTAGQTVNSSGVLSQASGTGAAIGISAMIVPTPQFTVAIGYMSSTNIPIQGNTQIIGSDTQNIPQGNFHSQLSLPSLLTIGIASRPVRGLTLEAGVQLSGWSSFDQIQYIYDNKATATVPANFQNTFSVRFGVEYVMAGVFAVRGGIKYMSSPVTDSSISPLYPDANAFQFGFGIGLYFSKNIRLDLAYAGNSFSDRNATLYGNYGTYSIGQNQLAATFSYAFEPTSNPLNAPLK